MLKWGNFDAAIVLVVDQNETSRMTSKNITLMSSLLNIIKCFTPPPPPPPHPLWTQDVNYILAFCEFQVLKFDHVFKHHKEYSWLFFLWIIKFLGGFKSSPLSLRKSNAITRGENYSFIVSSDDLFNSVY